MKLYDFELSGICSKVRLLLSLLDLGYAQEPVELGKQNHSSEFLH